MDIKKNHTQKTVGARLNYKHNLQKAGHQNG